MTELRRGSVVLYAERGDYSGKPRPGVVVQRSRSLANAPSITLCGTTTTALAYTVTRVPLSPSADNGLTDRSFVMTDKISTIRRERIRDHIGILSDDELALVDDALRAWLDL